MVTERNSAGHVRPVLRFEHEWHVNDDPDPTTPWKKGFEIELLAPRGLTRRDLAARIAGRVGGRVEPCFYPQSEPSLVPDLPVFENLILGFEVLDQRDERIALLVDDLTIRADLDREAAPKPGWLRILSDEARLLSLVQQNCSAQAPFDQVLAPLAALFGTEVEQPDPQVCKVNDASGRSIAMATTLPGERERPCEIITAPIQSDATAVLEALMADAQALGFTVPVEAALHVHFDGAALCSAPVLSRLLIALHTYRDQLRDRVKTNPACVRLGATHPDIITLVGSDAFRSADWPQARALLTKLKPTKYCDFNIANLVYGLKQKHTFEVRIFPGTMNPQEMVANAALFERILRWAVAGPDTPLPDRLEEFLERCA